MVYLWLIIGITTNIWLVVTGTDWNFGPFPQELGYVGMRIQFFRGIVLPTRQEKG